MNGRLATAGYRLGWLLIRLLPAGSAGWLADRTADLAHRRGGARVRRLAANLARVAPDADPDTLIRAALRSYARYWLEVFRLPTLPAEVFPDRVTAVGFENILAAKSRGRGVILALPHMANWDLAGAWLVAMGLPFTTVAERLRPERLFDLFVEFRRGLGMEVLPLTGGAAPPFELLAERLRAGGVLCLVADRDLTVRGVPVRFFGEIATMPAGPALLALRTGAALLPVTLWWPDPTPDTVMTVRIRPPVPVSDGGGLRDRAAAMTQALADAFAEDIAAHPADWHMLSVLWRTDRPAGTARREGEAA